MATFEYNALTSAGRLMTGTIEAGSNDEAKELLEQMQLKINSIVKTRPRKSKTPIGRSEFLLFNQQLASITKAGIPLEKGLRELSKDIASKKMRKLIDRIVTDLEAGVSIEDAFEKREKFFPSLYGKILKAGVKTGRLSEMLTSLNRHLEVRNQTKRIVFEAVAYPVVILALAAVITTAVSLIIIPPFKTVLTEMISGKLNPITTTFFALSDNILPFWLFAAVLALAIVFTVKALSLSPAGKRFKEWLFLKLPVFGRLYHSSILSKMSESMAMLVASGSDMPSCFRLSSQASGSERLAAEGEVVAGEIEQGTNIIEAGQFCKTIPRLFLYSIQLGSQRNELQDNLLSLSRMYAEQVRCSQVRLQAILLPVMLCFVGGFVALVVLAMFLPLVQVVQGLSGG